ncbi:MAG: tetratricopeptide repeat protein [Gammaproteobacteria bacterium]|nr:tetratricopeptide repeat protein [Gammaproteobacteria bacterium]
MQAGLVCRYIDERYGHAKLGEMLLAYREGLDTSEAIGRALGLDAPKFDREFQSYVETEFGAFLAGLESWRRSHAELGRLVDSGSWKRAAELADELLAEHPAYVEPDSPWLALARARDELGQPDAALAALRDYWSRGGYDPAALKDLAERLVAGAEHATAIDVLNTVALVQPLDDELHGALGDLLLEAGRPAEALREYGILLALEPHDRADAYFRLARAHSRSGNIEQSKQYLLAALDIAPGYRPAQRLLLELTRAGQDQ